MLSHCAMNSTENPMMFHPSGISSLPRWTCTSRVSRLVVDGEIEILSILPYSQHHPNERICIYVCEYCPFLIFRIVYVWTYLNILEHIWTYLNILEHIWWYWNGQQENYMIKKKKNILIICFMFWMWWDSTPKKRERTDDHAWDDR